MQPRALQPGEPVFVGLSLSKPMTVESLRNQIQQAIALGGPVAVVIADSIAELDYREVDGYSAARAARVVKRKSLAIRGLLAEALAALNNPPVVVLGWSDVQDPTYATQHACIEQAFERSHEFQAEVLTILDQYLERRRRTLDQPARLRLARYLLAELPTFIDGIRHNGIAYRALLCETFGSRGMQDLALAIVRNKYDLGLQCHEVAFL